MGEFIFGIATKAAKRPELFYTVRDALIKVVVSFAGTKILEKAYNAVEKDLAKKSEEHNTKEKTV